MRGQEGDDGSPVVRTAGAAYFMKLGVQQLFKALTTAPNPGMVEFDFERLKFLK